MMVYGLNVKPVHGYYVDTELVGGDFDRPELVDPTPDGGYTPQGLYSGRHVKTDSFPKQIKWLDENGHGVPDFDRQHCLNVSQRAKELIESVEPGVHQFVPVEYLDKDGSHLEDRYVLIVGHRIDSLDHDKTTMVLVKGKFWRPPGDLAEMPELIPAGFDVDAPPKMVFNLSQIDGAHMWCDKHLTSRGVFLSDEFSKVLKHRGLSGLRLSDDGVESVA